MESPSDENSEKTHFCQGGPKFEGGIAGKFRDNGQQEENSSLHKLVVVIILCLEENAEF